MSIGTLMLSSGTYWIGSLATLIEKQAREMPQKERRVAKYHKRKSSGIIKSGSRKFLHVSLPNVSFTYSDYRKGSISKGDILRRISRK